MKTLFLFLILLNISYSQDKIIIDDTIKLEKTKEYYEKKENLLNEVPQVKQKQKQKRKDKLNIDGDVGVDKETKTIDNVNINIGSKF